MRHQPILDLPQGALWLGIAQDIQALPKPQVPLVAALISVQPALPLELKTFILEQLYARAPFDVTSPVWQAAAEFGAHTRVRSLGAQVGEAGVPLEFLRCMGLVTHLVAACLFLGDLSERLRAA